jgi:hypothetical protein
MEFGLGPQIYRNTDSEGQIYFCGHRWSSCSDADALTIKSRLRPIYSLIKVTGYPRGGGGGMR